MKKGFKHIVLILLAAAVLLMACRKENSCEGCATKNNKPPISVAGPDQQITLPTDGVSLDGRTSTDPDGRISGFVWTKFSGPVSLNILIPLFIKEG